MAHTCSIDMHLAVPTPSLAIPKLRASNDHSGTANFEKLASALLTPPTSLSPDLAAHAAHDRISSPTPINIARDQLDDDGHFQASPHSLGVPLSRGALSDLDGSAAITPSMLAKHHLPAIMLGNGPRPIRYVMGELTHTVPGFSRIPPAKARRIVVAALESRAGGGPDGNIAFCKTGWGRWDAHVKGSSRDSGVGSFNEGRLSPPRSERSSYAMSYTDSAIHMHGPPLPSAHRDQHSGASWSASSIREEDEYDMDVLEEAADKMSLDGESEGSSSMDEDTDEEDWAAAGVEALRKASLSVPAGPRQNYRAVSITPSARGPSREASRRPSASLAARPFHSASVPVGGNPAFTRSLAQTPEEHAAIEALMSMGSIPSWVSQHRLHSCVISSGSFPWLELSGRTFIDYAWEPHSVLRHGHVHLPSDNPPLANPEGHRATRPLLSVGIHGASFYRPCHGRPSRNALITSLWSSSSQLRSSSRSASPQAITSFYSKTPVSIPWLALAPCSSERRSTTRPEVVSDHASFGTHVE
ncbi:hypothetical protein MRB53_041008 [Persea americana]|nr:hypothetical protein MRB53_041008 [Persea americana]